LLSWCGVAFFCTVIAVITHGINMIMMSRAEGTHQWKHECFEICSDCAALASGLLISLTIRMSVSGNLPPVHGSPRYKTQFEVWALLGMAIALVPVVLMASMWKFKVHHEDHDGEHVPQWRLRFTETAQMNAAFATGWTLLYWGYWTFYQTQGDADEDFGPEVSIIRIVVHQWWLYTLLREIRRETRSIVFDRSTVFFDPALPSSSSTCSP